MKIKSDDKEVYIVSPLTVVLIVIAVAMLAAVIALYFVGKKAQKRPVSYTHLTLPTN